MFYNRISARVKTQDTRIYEIYYRATQTMHNRAMNVFGILVPALVTGAQLLILASLFLVIRIGVSSGILFIILDVPLGIMCFICLKTGIEFASNVTELSQNCSWTPFLNHRPDFTKKDRIFLKSCALLKFKVGETFTITKVSFPTMSQQIILGNLVNLLVLFE